MMALINHWRVAALIGLCVAGLALYALGRHDGKSQAAYDTVKATAEAYQKRAGTNEKINSLDPAALCVELAGCATNASNCAGWQKISVKPATAVYLAGSDVSAGQGIASHNTYGKQAGCW